MALYQSLPEYIHHCGGFTDASRNMATTPQTLFNALKAKRQILVKLNESKDYMEAYEIKPFPCQKLSKV
jgi:hypothetical protein